MTAKSLCSDARARTTHTVGVSIKLQVSKLVVSKLL